MSFIPARGRAVAGLAPYWRCLQGCFGIRQLNNREGNQVRDLAKRQIENLRQRIVLIRSMQRWGVISFILCTLSMFTLFMQWDLAGQWFFGASLASLVLSLTVSLYEIQISCNAINIELESLENR